jgi:hypothetical protein
MSNTGCLIPVSTIFVFESPAYQNACNTVYLNVSTTYGLNNQNNFGNTSNNKVEMLDGVVQLCNIDKNKISFLIGAGIGCCIGGYKLLFCIIHFFLFF